MSLKLLIFTCLILFHFQLASMAMKAADDSNSNGHKGDHMEANMTPLQTRLTQDAFSLSLKMPGIKIFYAQKTSIKVGDVPDDPMDAVLHMLGPNDRHLKCETMGEAETQRKCRHLRAFHDALRRWINYVKFKSAKNGGTRVVPKTEKAMKEEYTNLAVRPVLSEKELTPENGIDAIIKIAIGAVHEWKKNGGKNGGEPMGWWNQAACDLLADWVDRAKLKKGQKGENKKAAETAVAFAYSNEQNALAGHAQFSENFTKEFGKVQFDEKVPPPNHGSA